MQDGKKGPNCTVACIQREGEYYCNPNCDLPDVLKDYPDHLRPDILIQYESIYMNIIVYIVAILAFGAMVAYAVYKTYLNCQLAKQVVQKSKETILMISNYSIKALSKTLKRKTLEKLQNHLIENGKPPQQTKV